MVKATPRLIIIIIIINVKITLEQATKGQRGSRGVALLFHDRSTRRWVSGQQHAPAAF